MWFEMKFEDASNRVMMGCCGSMEGTCLCISITRDSHSLMGLPMVDVTSNKWCKKLGVM